MQKHNKNVSADQIIRFGKKCQPIQNMCTYLEDSLLSIKTTKNPENQDSSHLPYVHNGRLKRYIKQYFDRKKTEPTILYDDFNNSKEKLGIRKYKSPSLQHGDQKKSFFQSKELFKNVKLLSTKDTKYSSKLIISADQKSNKQFRENQSKNIKNRLIERMSKKKLIQRILKKCEKMKEIFRYQNQMSIANVERSESLHLKKPTLKNQFTKKHPSVNNLAKTIEKKPDNLILNVSFSEKYANLIEYNNSIKKIEPIIIEKCHESEYEDQQNEKKVKMPHSNQYKKRENIFKTKKLCINQKKPFSEYEEISPWLVQSKID